MFTKFGLNRSIRVQDIEQNSILTSIKGSNSVANLPKFELIQAFMRFLLACRVHNTLVNFVCIVFELGDKMLTLSSMENLIVQCNLQE